MNCSVRRVLVEVGVMSLSCALANVLVDVIMMTAPAESAGWLAAVERTVNCSVRRVLVEVGVMSLSCALANVLVDVIMMTAPAESAGWLAAVLSVVSVALPILLVVAEVRAWLAITRAGKDVFGFSGKVVLGAALWFGGSLPAGIVAFVRALLLGSVASVAPMFRVQAGLALGCIASSAPRVAQVL